MPKFDTILLPLHKRWQYKFARKNDILLSQALQCESSIRYITINTGHSIGPGTTYVWLQARRTGGRKDTYSITQHSIDHTPVGNAQGRASAYTKAGRGPFTRDEVLNIFAAWVNPDHTPLNRGKIRAQLPFPADAARLVAAVEAPQNQQPAAAPHLKK